MPSKDAATPSRCLIFPVRNSDTANHTADAMLENKVYFCKKDMLSLLETAETLIPDDLLKDHTDDPDISINTEAWGRYKKILYGFMAAEYSGWRISCIRHAEAPSLVRTYSSIMITLPKSCTFTDEAKTAIIRRHIQSRKSQRFVVYPKQHFTVLYRLKVRKHRKSRSGVDNLGAGKFIVDFEGNKVSG